jgi:hypothetical protein
MILFDEILELKEPCLLHKGGCRHVHLTIDLSKGALSQQLFECREILRDIGQDHILEINTGLLHIIIHNILADNRLGATVLKLMFDFLARINRTDRSDLGPNLECGKISDHILGTI